MSTRSPTKSQTSSTLLLPPSSCHRPASPQTRSSEMMAASSDLTSRCRLKLPSCWQRILVCSAFKKAKMNTKTDKFLAKTLPITAPSTSHPRASSLNTTSPTAHCTMPQTAWVSSRYPKMPTPRKTWTHSTPSMPQTFQKAPDPRTT